MTIRDSSVPNLLSIAGSDPGGGAGIQADLKTFAAFGCHGMAAITALTAQNTMGVSVVHLPPASIVAEQIRMIFADITVDAVKIGMLGSRDIVAAVAASLRSWHGGPIVLDPVLVATSGASLGDADVVVAMRELLFPLATLITPNLTEAVRLGATDPLDDRTAIENAAKTLRADGAAAWLVKGGHGTGDTAEDCLVDAEDAHWFAAPRIDTRDTHGTGCTLSSAIAANLAHGLALTEAIQAAKAYVTDGLRGASRLSVGEGPGPLDHFARWR